MSLLWRNAYSVSESKKLASCSDFSSSCTVSAVHASTFTLPAVTLNAISLFWDDNVKSATLGSLSNHDSDSNKLKTSQIWIFDDEKQIVRFALTFFILRHFADVLVLFTTWNDLFCSDVDDVRTLPQIFNLVLLSLKRWFQFNYMILRTHFASIVTLNNGNAKLHFQITFLLSSVDDVFA